METKATTAATAAPKKYPSTFETKDGTKKVELFTPPGRQSFPHLVEPDAAEEGEEPKYKHDLLFSAGTDLTDLEAAIETVGSAKFGKQWDKIKAKSYPLKDGDDKDLEKYPQYAGVRFITPKSKYKPKVFDRMRQEFADGETIPSGHWVRDLVTVYPYVGKKSSGVAIALTAVKHVRPDETFGGGGGSKVDANDFPDDGVAGDEDDLPPF